MPRPRRVDPPNAWHHVVNRGARRFDLFLDDDDRHLFLALVVKASERYRVEVASFCLMHNHFHLVVFCREGSVSAFVQHFASSYARAFNENHGFDGPLAKSRFFSDLITSDQYLLTATRYVHRNPLELGYEISSYPWSSYRDYLEPGAGRAWLEPSVPLALAGGVRGYRSFVEQDQRTDKAMLSAGTRRMLADVPLVAVAPSLDDIDLAVARSVGARVDDVHAVQPGQANRVRQLALILATEARTISTKEIARHYGFSSSASLRATASRARSAVAANPEWTLKLCAVRSALEDDRGQRAA